MSHSSIGHRPRRLTVLRCALLLASLAAGLSACNDGNPLADSPYDAHVAVAYGTAGGGKADPNKPLRVSAEDGSRITDVTATDSNGRYIRGELSADGRKWHSTAALAAGAHYTVRVSTEDSDGHPGRKVATFDTTPAGAGLHVTFGPEAGTYGVGQPVTATLSVPVKDPAGRAAVESSLHVSSVPQAAQGSWYWVDDRTLHYRPRVYWPTHATITVTSSLQGVRVGNSLYGGSDKPLTLHTGDRIEAITDAGSHEMTFKDDGKVLKTFPITTGKPGYDTRNGIKVVLEKAQFVQMKSSTVGISDFYDLPVYWATRVTWSGEYVHAAPWSEGSQGYANVSHGCTGMSTENAEWFFDHVRRGDIVQVINSDGATMSPFDNGFGDWNLSWDQWRKGSALTGGGGGVTPKLPTPGSGTDQPPTRITEDHPPSDPARLRPEAA
nr:Ig-like domain-containing protein [Streptomyces sp. HPF1205]